MQPCHVAEARERPQLATHLRVQGAACARRGSETAASWSLRPRPAALREQVAKAPPRGSRPLACVDVPGDRRTELRRLDDHHARPRRPGPGGICLAGAALHLVHRHHLRALQRGNGSRLRARVHGVSARELARALRSALPAHRSVAASTAGRSGDGRAHPLPPAEGTASIRDVRGGRLRASLGHSRSTVSTVASP